MSDEFKNIVRVACVYATSVVGAGFASGQEIMQFFSVYRVGGFFGVILAGILFSLIGTIVLEMVYKGRIRNYEEFVFPVYGWFIGWVLEILVTVFMLCLYCVMIAGAGTVLSDRLNIHIVYAVLIMCFGCMAMISTKIKGIVTFSTVVAPILIAGIVLTGLYIIFFSDAGVFAISGFIARVTGNWFFSSILYVSYNSILAIVMMCSLLPYLKTRRTARLGGILGGVLLSCTALVVNTAIYMFYPTAYEKELPILSILKSFNGAAGNAYAAVLWVAMTVSAVTAGFCFSDRLEKIMKIDRRIAIVVLCIGSIPLSLTGFSGLIAKIYPIFGYLGLFMILVVIGQGFADINGGQREKCGRK